MAAARTHATRLAMTPPVPCLGRAARRAALLLLFCLTLTAVLGATQAHAAGGSFTLYACSNDGGGENRIFSPGGQANAGCQPGYGMQTNADGNIFLWDGGIVGYYAQSGTHVSGYYAQVYTSALGGGPHCINALSDQATGYVVGNSYCIGNTFTPLSYGWAEWGHGPGTYNWGGVLLAAQCGFAGQGTCNNWEHAYWKNVQ